MTGSQRTFRPRRARAVVAAAAVLLLLAMLGLGLAVPGGRGWATVTDRASLLVFWLVVMVVLVRLYRVRVELDDEGLHVVNLVRERRLAWAEVVGIRLGPGDPWVALDLNDGTTLAAMGIQRADGQEGQRAARELAELVAAHQAAGPFGPPPTVT